MYRRDLLRSACAALTGGALTVHPPEPALVAQPQRSPSPSRPRFVEAADGTRVFYRDWGAGFPIVFAAPWGLNADWWDFHMTALSEHGFRCVAYDRRGHGRSDDSGRGYDFDTLADDLHALLTQLALSSVMLVGHSMGAAEIVRYLVRHRSPRVVRALFVAPTTPFILKTDDNPDGVAKEILEQGRAGLRKERIARIAQAAPSFFGAANPVPAETIDWWTRMMVDRCSTKVMLDLHRAFTETDFRKDLAQIDVPTTIVHGDRDASAPLESTGRRTHTLLRGSELIVYEGAAHGLPVTHAERLLTDMIAQAKLAAQA
jgi:non-heme chloroperoxidase